MGFGGFPNATTPLGDTDIFLVEQGGNTKQVTARELNVVPANARAEFVTGTFTVATATDTDLEFDTQVFDNGGFFDLGTPDRMVVPANLGGVYAIHGGVLFDGNGSGYREMEIQVNGSPVANDRIIGDTDVRLFTTSTIINLAAADVVTLQVFQNSGGNLDVNGSSRNFLALARLAIP